MSALIEFVEMHKNRRKERVGGDVERSKGKEGSKKGREREENQKRKNGRGTKKKSVGKKKASLSLQIGAVCGLSFTPGRLNVRLGLSLGRQPELNASGILLRPSENFLGCSCDLLIPFYIKELL